MEEERIWPRDLFLSLSFYPGMFRLERDIHHMDDPSIVTSNSGIFLSFFAVTILGSSI